MARKTKPLTDTEIKAAKSKDADYLLYDGDGLTLLVKHSGSKLMRLGSTVDDLLELPENQKEHKIDDLYSVRIAYQTPISTHLPATGEAIQAFPNTFEDSFVLSNAGHFAEKANGTGLMKAFVKVLNEAQSPEAVGEGFFNELREGKKAEFVLLVLNDKNFPSLKIPDYIMEGLNWLESKLRSKQKELLVIPTEAAEVTS